MRLAVVGDADAMSRDPQKLQVDGFPVNWSNKRYPAQLTQRQARLVG
jgi:hypothetical protein